MEIVVIAIIVMFIVFVFFILFEVILAFFFGLLAIIILPFAAIFDCIKAKKKTKKDRRDEPTVWRRKR